MRIKDIIEMRSMTLKQMSYVYASIYDNNKTADDIIANINALIPLTPRITEAKGAPLQIFNLVLGLETYIDDYGLNNTLGPIQIKLVDDTLTVLDDVDGYIEYSDVTRIYRAEWVFKEIFGKLSESEVRLHKAREILSVYMDLSKGELNKDYTGSGDTVKQVITTEHKKPVLVETILTELRDCYDAIDNENLKKSPPKTIML